MRLTASTYRSGEAPVRPPDAPGWAVVDVETTGLHPARDRVVEIAVVRLDPDGARLDEWTTLIDPGRSATGRRIHGIAPDEVAGAPAFAAVAHELLARLAGYVIVAHNAPFDVSFLQAETIRAGIAWGPVEGLCTMEVLHALRLTHTRKLHECCTELGVPAGREHVAVDDARATAGLVEYLGPRLWTIDAPAPAPPWPVPTTGVSLRPRLGAPSPAPAADVGRHVRVPGGLGVSEAAASTYLALLDHVLEDGTVSSKEVDALSLFAHACGISRDVARRLHLAYLEEVSRLALADGVVTDAERAHLLALTPLLSAALPR